MADDQFVVGRSNEYIENAAEQCRLALGLSTDEPVGNILQFLKLAARSDLAAVRGLELIRFSVERNSKVEAFAERKAGSAPKIGMRSDVYKDAELDKPRARMTMVHELAHLFLHPTETTNFRKSGYEKHANVVHAFSSAEHQAKVFAAAFLMPRFLVEAVGCSNELAALCKVSEEAAEIRWRQIRRAKGRLPPAEVLEFLKPSSVSVLAHRKNGTEISQAIEKEIDDAWNRCATEVNRDPTQYRLTAKGYEVFRAHYLQPKSHYGWHFRNRRIESYMESD
jgi:hypothetical protein